MKSLARLILINCLSLFLLELLVSGFSISGGFIPLLLSGLVLTILFKTVKPVLQVLSLPLNAITFGLFSFAINALLLWIASLFVKDIHITFFASHRIVFAGFIIPGVIIHNLPFVYLMLAVILCVIIACITWIVTD